MGLVFFYPANNIHAQAERSIDPGAIRERSMDTQEYYTLEKKLTEQKEPDQGKSRIEDKTKEDSGQGQEAVDETVFINRIETGASEILSAEEIRNITERYEGKSISIKDLFMVIKDINELYASKKFIAARAVLPPQKVEKGVVRIQLIEGHVGKILVEDNEYIQNSFFTNRISLKNGDLVRLDRLEKDIFYLNNTNDVQVRAELKAGESVGTTDCIIRVKEPERYQVSLFSDNAGRDTVGLYRFGMILGFNSLLGYADRFNMNLLYTNRRGTTAGSLSYDVPVTTRGTRLGVSYDHNKIKVISGPFEVLNVSGDSSSLGLDLTQPIIVRSSLKLNGFTGIHLKKSATDFDDATLFKSKVKTMDIGMDAQSLDTSGAWYSNIRVTTGNDSFDGQGHFARFNLFLSRQQVLAKDFIFVFRGNAQVSNKKILPTSEEFQIGGMSSVRGYQEGVLIGYKGYVVNGELYFPVPFTSGASFRDKLKGMVFIDHGGAFPYKGEGAAAHDDYLTGAGVGLVMNISRYFTGRLNLGIPLRNRDDVEQGCMLHFYLQSRIF